MGNVIPFHAHLDECERCRTKPFDLCEKGAVLLVESAQATNPSCRHGFASYNGECDDPQCALALTQELAAVRAELETHKEARAADLRESADCGERARRIAASVAVLVSYLDRARDLVNARIGGKHVLQYGARLCAFIADYDATTANLPAATQSHLREVEALRGVAAEARYVLTQCNHPNLEKDIAALDAVEAGKKAAA